MKIKKIFNEINVFIDKLDNKKWLVICFFLNLVVLVLLNKEIIYEPYIHGEDGAVFVADSLKYGIGSLKIPFGGYLYVMPRLFSLIGLFFGKSFGSVLVLANVMKILSTLFMAFVPTYFCSDSFSNLIKSRKARLVSSMLVIINIAAFINILYNSVSTHWWSGILALLCSFQFFNKKAPSYAILPFLLLSIVSSASSMVVGFSVVYYIISKINFKHIIESFKNNFTKHDYIKLSLIVLFLAMQAYTILFVSGVTDESSFVGSFSLVSLIDSTVRLVLNAGNYIFGIDITFRLYPNGMNYIIGSIVWIILLIVAIRTKKVKLFFAVLLEITALYVICTYKRVSAFGDGYQLLIGEYRGRLWYNVPTSSLMIILGLILLYNLLKSFKKFNTIFNIMFYTIIIILGIRYGKCVGKPDFTKCDNLRMIEKYVDFNSRKYAIITTSDWYVPVPVNDEYCKKNECKNEIPKYN